MLTKFMYSRNLRSHEALERLGFLYESYNPNMWFYEVVELFRKVCLISCCGVRCSLFIEQLLLKLVTHHSPSVCTAGTERSDVIRALLLPFRAAGVWLPGVLLLSGPPLPAPLSPAR
jgi:hypothetical protein